jgi:glucose-1-phosphatase
LGNVLLPIDFSAPVKAFAEIGLKDFDALYGKIQQSDLFNLLETGKISEQYFRNEMRRISGIDWTDLQIDDAWSSILLSFRQETLDMLVSLKSQYNLFLLSNTNSIHFVRYNLQVQEKYNPNGLKSFFNKAYLSHEIGMRKPNVEIFRFVLKDAHILASNALFIDDNNENILSAKDLGFQVLHISPEDKIERILLEYLKS